MTRTASSQARFFRAYALGALILMMLMLAVSAAQAQDTPLPYDAFFIAPSEGQLDQVWGLTLADMKTSLLTQDPWGVANYAVSPDQTQIAYVNSGSLWLQPMGGTPEKLTTIEDDIQLVSLAFSPDGESLFYSNKGLFLMSLDTRQSEQLLTDGNYDETGNPADLRRYSPNRFLEDDRLLVTVWSWESKAAAIYVVSSGTLLQTPDLYTGLQITALEDGRYLYYSDARMGLSIDAFLIGMPSDDPQTPFELVPLLADDFAAQNLVSPFIADAVEIAPGTIRFLGTAFRSQNNDFLSFLGEYDFNTNTLMLDTSQTTADALFFLAYFNMFNSDGHYVAGYKDTSFEGPNQRGQLVIANIDTMTVNTIDSVESVMHFRWAGE